MPRHLRRRRPIRARVAVTTAALTAGALAIAALAFGCTPSIDPSSAPSGATPPSSMATGPTSPTPATSPSATPTPTPARTASVVMSGDLLWHSGLWETAAQVARRTGHTPYDFSELFAHVRPIIRGADLAICHEEVPMAPDGTDPSGYPVFGAPQEVAPAIAAVGWDLCTTSSNHSMDRGLAGISTTLREFDEQGILHTGTFRSAKERATPTLFTTAQGVRIAVVSGTYSTNGIPLPQGHEWSVAMLDTADMIARAKAARVAGADIVLAAVHAGDEYVSTPNEQQVRAARELTASDAIDLVYGHHVHVVQPWDVVNGKWVVYGLGNMVATPPVDFRRSHEGVTARFTFTERSDGRFVVTRAEYLPTMVDSYWAGQEPVLWPVVSALAAGVGDTADLEVARRVTHDTVFALGVKEIRSGSGAAPADGSGGGAPTADGSGSGAAVDASGEPVPAAGLEER